MRNFAPFFSSEHPALGAMTCHHATVWHYKNVHPLCGLGRFDIRSTLARPEHPIRDFFPVPGFVPGTGKISQILNFLESLCMPQSRRHERPRSSRSQHSNPGGTSCRSSASLAQIIAAAMI